ncbi:MAG TPA: RagB/SusD family nutrient uptake outer membrane protein [Chitinophagaceae bacterium]
MNTIKRILWGLVIAIPICTLLPGCKKFLDRKPLTATFDDLNQGGVEGLIFGLYGGIRNPDIAGIGFGGINWLGMHALRSDDQEIVADPGAGGWHTTYDLFQYVKDDWSTNEYWARHYTLINLANTALHTIDSLGLTDQATLINEAEAKWFRAYSYFEMVRTYGQVPLIDFPVLKASDANIAKSTEAQIYALIDADLTFAAQHLPLNWIVAAGQPSKYPGRLTSGAARTLHAKALLYRQNWAGALGLLQTVIASGEYELTDEYWKIWKTAGENNKESIFEIQAYQSAGAADNYWSWWGTQQGVRGAGEWNLGWGWNTPTQNLVDAYETGDIRKESTILFSGQADGAATGGYGRTLPAYPSIPAKFWNKKTYADPAEQQVVGDPAGAAYINQRVLRYSDVLLMAAEAANEIGGAANEILATNWVNEVRNRAKLPDVAFVSKAQMRAVIKQERRVEFGMEGERFFDLVRWGDAPAVLGALGYQNRHRYYPLPSPAIAANPNLVQNPDYP